MKSTTRIIAGQELHDALQREKEERVPHSTKPGLEHCYASEPLCEWQSELSRRGILPAHLVDSIYGWSVRYASGLQDFGIIASARMGIVDGSLADAERFARKWVAEDPARRYVYVQEYEERVAA